MRLSGLLFACAVALSTTAAYYSIVGLATIFSGAYFAVIVMASILEISKLVIASWLYQKWDEVSVLLRTYLTSAVVVLMLITSLGIFGFLSKAHVEQSLENTAVELRISQLDQQMHQSREVVERYRAQLDQLDRSINIQLDNNRATQALAARQRQTAERDQIRQRLDAEQTKISELQQQRLQLRQQRSILESEVGPIRYVAELFLPPNSVDLEKAVRWMIIVLVMVFDPLAVLMLIAANMSLARERGPLVVPVEPEPVAKIEKPERPLGDILTVDGKPMRWWNGERWERFDDPEPNDDRMLRLIEDRIPHITGHLRKAMPGPDEIGIMVKASMDEWLTQAAVESKIEDDAADASDQVQQEPIKENEPVDGPPDEKRVQQDHARIDAKPSWL